MSVVDQHGAPTIEKRGAEGSAVERVLIHLRDGIRAGRLAPGQRLVEADLTAALGVSRGPVREAFRRLAAEGSIEIIPYRGALVRRLSLAETEELFQIRLELEALAARLAAIRTSSDPCIRQRFETATRPIWSDAVRISASEYVVENKQFHDAVVDAGGNRQLAELNTRLHLPLIMFQAAGALTAETLRQSVSEHRRIATAILDGDAASADRATRDHLTRAADVTRNMPKELFRP